MRQTKVRGGLSLTNVLLASPAEINSHCKHKKFHRVLLKRQSYGRYGTGT